MSATEDVMEYALQLYTVKDFVEFDMDYTFSRLQEFGYTGVEFGSFYSYTPEEINALLEKYNFKVLGAHVSIKQLEDEFESYLAFNRAIGNKNIVISGAETYDYEHMRDAIDRLKALKPRVEAEGFDFHYHTHDLDHKRNKKTGIVPFDVLVNECDINLELDTYWEYMAGIDPVEQMKRFKDRVKLIHVKDGDENRNPKYLGLGCAPVEAIVRYTVASGLPVIVESEGFTPDGITEAKRCAKYLKKLYPPQE